NPVAGRVDVQARIVPSCTDAPDTGLLKAEPAGRSRGRIFGSRRDADAVGPPWPQRPADEDLVLAVDGKGGRLLPGDPRTGRGRRGPREVDRRRLAVLILIEIE